ncbi:MAG: hypothetical protein KC444_02440 [Nitrosopumilus sp.]|nr:hypothetical protein [Nitrosopumilus sp.]
MISAKKGRISGRLSRTNTTEFYFLMACMMSVSLIQTTYAHAQSDGTQITFSDNLLNDPVAQDILKKIEQTKKMIADLEQKEYEKNQAQENLQKMRDMSVQRLKQDLDEWERLWEKQSSRNAFDGFVSKKPSYVQGVFWDQFEFTESKINAGRTAMNRVLADGGTMQDARSAYHEAASTQKIEIIEMNAQFNIKHNLAVYEEQQVFNSTGQVHLSPTTQIKLANMYSDYRLQPGYIIANSDEGTSGSNAAKCADGLVLVSQVTSASKSCIEKDVAKKWTDAGAKGIIISGEEPSLSEVKTNPGTSCKDGYQVIYDVATSEYQCVLESDAREMIESRTAENHTLVDYILNKDKSKIRSDAIHQINEKIREISQEYDLKKSTLEKKYDEVIENEDLQARQKIQDAIKEYRVKNITKEDVSKQISEIRKTADITQERILREKTDTAGILEIHLKDRIAELVKGYENDPGINVDWERLNEMPITMPSENKSEPTTKNIVTQNPSKDNMQINRIDLVNSLGQKIDSVKPDQIIQITADITNHSDYENNFVYIVEITDMDKITVQPAKWITGTLSPSQTLNVGLSWIPEEEGRFNAVVSVGNGTSSATPVDSIEIYVNPRTGI